MHSPQTKKFACNENGLNKLRFQNWLASDEQTAELHEQFYMNYLPEETSVVACFFYRYFNHVQINGWVVYGRETKYYLWLHLYTNVHVKDVYSPYHDHFWLTTEGSQGREGSRKTALLFNFVLRGIINWSYILRKGKSRM